MVICYDPPISIKIGDNNSQAHSVENEIIILIMIIIIITIIIIICGVIIDRK